MLLSVVSFLVVAQSSLEVLEGLMNNPVYRGTGRRFKNGSKVEHNSCKAEENMVANCLMTETTI